MKPEIAAANSARSAKKLDPGKTRARPDAGAIADVAASHRTAHPGAHPGPRSRPTEAALGRLKAAAQARGSAGRG